MEEILGWRKMRNVKTHLFLFLGKYYWNGQRKEYVMAGYVAHKRMKEYGGEANRQEKDWRFFFISIVAPCILIYVELTHQQMHFY